MRNKILFGLCSIAIIFLVSFSFNQNDPWTKMELISPAELAKQISNPKIETPAIFSIGPSGTIKTAIHIGEPTDEENLAKFKMELAKLPKNKAVVIYCGCCPFEKCPNIRPAFSLLKEMKFTNPKLLDFPKNLKADWIDKGYPMEEE